MTVSMPCLILTALIPLAALPVQAAGPPVERTPWPAAVEEALGRAGANRGEIVEALRSTAGQERRGMAFLIAHMPPRDLRSLRADFLLENVRLAYRVRAQVPWGSRIPEDVFLNDVLPYANLDEARHPWRKEMVDLCLPIVKGCKTPTEAAQKLNATLFAKTKVKYSTGRKKANQSPKETMETGLASCTGLAILLADACRSVGVPARVAGTPMWANNRGNHTWVEVWDGRWHFTGAAEYDANGLDRGWFAADAAQATKDSREHAIYAASFRRTGVTFPLVWDPDGREVFAENVTDRYTARLKPGVRVQIRVLREGKRLALPFVVEDHQHREVCRGLSKGEEADTNDILSVELLPGRAYVVRVGHPARAERRFTPLAAKDLLVEVEIPAAKPGLSPEQLAALTKEARAYFEADAKKQAAWKFDEKRDRLLAGNEAAIRAQVWKAYREASIHQAAKKDFAANQVRYKEYLSAYIVKKVGKKPAGGWPLFIAMHGGGGAPKQVNDSQWKMMQIYYKDQPSVAGYQYLALRAPNDTWNGFYDGYVPPLVINLIRQFVLFGEVDPDKVFLMGYSHGGYGAFYIGPLIPDRFAAVHASAAAPTDGTISPRTLRNTRFTFMIGEKDTAYGRADRCQTFNKAVEKLKKEDKDAFPVEMQFMKGFGHGGLPDRDKIKEMAAYRRDPVPRHLTWDLTTNVVDRFFWLAVPKPGADQAIDAKIADDAVVITTKNVKEFSLELDGRLVRFDRPLRVTLNGKQQSVEIRPSLLTLCRSMAARGDPELACTCEVKLTPIKP
jgi:transglutaminase-like putative cysteine protease/pimeloyl-ACP methyl ester carboxylesterase